MHTATQLSVSSHNTPPPLVSDIYSPQNNLGICEDGLIGTEPIEHSLLAEPQVEPQVELVAQGAVMEFRLEDTHLDLSTLC